MSQGTGNGDGRRQYKRATAKHLRALGGAQPRYARGRRGEWQKEARARPQLSNSLTVMCYWSSIRLRVFFVAQQNIHLSPTVY